MFSLSCYYRILVLNNVYLYDQLALAKSELGRLNEENKQLKDMLSRMTIKFNAFQVQMPVYTTLMQQQQQRTNNHQALLRGAPGHEVNHCHTKTHASM